MDSSRKDIGNGYYGENRGGDGADQEKGPSKVDDFEDYMWMANAEEEEKEMLQQIEDEQTADKCFGDMLEEEERSRNADINHCWQGGRQWSSGCPVQGQPAQLQQPFSTYPELVTTEALANGIRSLLVNEKPKVELNPMAAEFVPGQAFQPASG